VKVAGISSETSAVSERYANALFDLAREQGSLDKTDKALTAFAAAMVQSADLDRLVRSPVFSAAEQSAGLAAVLNALGIAGLTHDFLLVLVRNRRLFVIGAIIRAFRERLARERGEVEAEVASAVQLSKAQEQALADVLRQTVGRTPKLNVRVDPALLGGLVVKVGSRMIDTSIRTKLNSLKVAMKEAG
jgi:F-type H+-transporting ATPase subunit delta